MVRTWSEEVGDPRSVIEPLAREVLPAAELDISTGGDLGVATAELIVRRADRQARCIVTFEAWEQARANPEGMGKALREVGRALEDSTPAPAYVLTSRGLERESRDKESSLLAAVAHGIEADVLAQRFFKQDLRR